MEFAHEGVEHAGSGRVMQLFGDRVRRSDEDQIVFEDMFGGRIS